MRLLVVFAAMLVSGCLSEGSEGVSGQEPDPEPAGFYMGVPETQEWDVLIDWFGGNQEFDALCLMGGGIKIARSGPLVTMNATEMFVEVTVPQTMTGYQAGFSMDGGEVTWLDVVTGGNSANMTVELGADYVEDSDYRWDFHGQANVPVAEQACYTGGGEGPPEIRVVIHNF